jgi:DNA polymerase III subunit gamma/tau
VRLLDLLGAALRAVKDGADARTQLELALVKAAAPEVDPSARALLARIERLEGALQDGAPAPRHAPPDRAVAPPDPEPAPKPERAAPAQAPPHAEAAAPATQQAAVAVAEAGAVVTLDGVRAVWPAVLDAVRADNQLLGAVLAEAQPVEVRGGDLVIAFADGQGFNRRMADGRANRSLLEDALRRLHGDGVRVCFELRALADDPAQAPPAPPTDEELVARFKAEFDAEEIVPDPEPQTGDA